MFVAGLASSFFASMLWDAIKISYSKTVLPLRLNMESKEQITDYLHGLENNGDLNATNLSNLQSFFQAPQIQDFIRSYYEYLLTGKKCKDLDTDMPSAIITADQIAIRLVDQYFTMFDDATVQQTELTELFHKYLDRTRTIIFERLPQNDRLQVFLYADTLSAKFRDLRSDLERAESRLLFALKQSIVQPNRSYDEIKDKYNMSIRELYSKEFIYLLDYFTFSDFYVLPIILPEDSNEMPLFSRISSILTGSTLNAYRKIWETIFDDDDIVYIVGKAGTGKSLFLKNLVINTQHLNIPNWEEYLVFLCDLKTFRVDSSGKPESVLEFLQDSIVRSTGHDTSTITKDFIEYFLNCGRCFVFLDALDEVPKGERTALHRKIVSYFSTINPNNKVCITSRSRGFVPQRSVATYEIMPLCKQDVCDYLDKMIVLNRFKKEDKDYFLKQAESLIEKGFLDSFLVLSLLVNIFRSERKLPKNKIELYKKCFDYIAKDREQKKSKTGFDWDKISPMMKESTFVALSNLAAPSNRDITKQEFEELLMTLYKNKFYDSAAADLAVSEFIEFCSERTELIVLGANDNQFRFFHRSFFEYFYAKNIYQTSQIDKMYELVCKLDIDSETVELLVALMQEENEKMYQSFIELLLGKAESALLTSEANKDVQAFLILSLAMQVVDDAQYLKKYFSIITNNPKQLATILKPQHSPFLYRIIRDICNNREERFETQIIEAYTPDIVAFFLVALGKTSEETIFEALEYRKALDERRIDSEKTSEMISSFVSSYHLARKNLAMAAPFYVKLFMSTNESIFTLIREYCYDDAKYSSLLEESRNKTAKRRIKSGKDMLFLRFTKETIEDIEQLVNEMY